MSQSDSSENDKHSDRAQRCNTGAQNRYLVDWISVTFPVDDLDDVLSRLGLDNIPIEREGKGRHGYNRSISLDGITVLYDGREGMGIHAILSSQSLHVLEDRGIYLKDYTARLRACQGRIRRFDIALDVFDVPIVSALQRAIERKQLVTRWKGYRIIRSGEVRKDGTGDTVYFGSPRSLVLLRAYDKAAETGTDGLWNRLELQLRNERAEKCVDAWLQGLSTGDVFAGVLANYLRVEAPWWQRFVGDMARIRLTSGKRARSADELIAWFEKNMTPTLATIFELQGGDLGYFAHLLELGRANLSSRHYQILKEAYECGSKSQF